MPFCNVIIYLSQNTTTTDSNRTTIFFVDIFNLLMYYDIIRTKLYVFLINVKKTTRKCVMSSYLITTEATSDYPVSIKEKDFAIIPMSYSVCGEDYDGDARKLTPKEFYDACRNAKTKEDLPTTAMVTAYTAKEFFTPYLEKGFDIIHVGFSSQLSGTFDQICAATKELREEFPDRRITVVDSKAACFVEGLIAYYALRARENGATYDECVSLVEKLSNQSCGFFTIEDINHLCRTGRVTKAEAFIGATLHIKPILHINSEGKLIPVTKAISKKRAMRGVIELAKKKMLPPEQQKLVGIGHADAYEDAVALEKAVKEELGVENTVIFDVGSVIGSHVGAGMLAVVLLCSDRNI